jgi:membrane protein implicated in regulation of membrane protease activity
VTVVSSMGGLPWWLDLAGITAVLVVGSAVAHRAWRRERLAATEQPETPSREAVEGLPS